MATKIYDDPYDNYNAPVEHIEMRSKITAPDLCNHAAFLMEERGKQRDSENGERSMARCVHAFNAMTGHQLSTEDGWLFMIYLKHSRMRAGGFTQDDYEDAVAYEALMGEEAITRSA